MQDTVVKTGSDDQPVQAAKKEGESSENELAWKPLAYSPADTSRNTSKSCTSKPTSINLEVCVFTDEGTKTFIIQCGPGTQTIKWLSLAAGQRFAAWTSTESFGQAAYSSKVVLPYTLCDMNGRTLDPKERVCNVLKDKDTVQCHLSASVGWRGGSTEMAVNDFGVPRTLCSDFSRKAFYSSPGCHSAKSLLAHQTMQKSKILNCDDAYTRGQTQSKHERRKSEDRRSKLAEGKRQAFYDQMYQSATSGDTGVESGQGVVRSVIDNTQIDSLCDGDEKAVAKFHGVLVVKIGDLQDMFNYYAASSVGDSLASMSLLEFRNFVFDLGLAPPGMNAEQLLAHIWGSTNTNSTHNANSSTNKDSMDLEEFIEGAVRLAKVAFPGIPLGESFQRFIEEKLEPGFAKKSESAVRKQMQKPEARQLLGKNVVALTEVYKYYAMKNDTLADVRTVTRPALDYKEFLMLLQDAGVVARPDARKKQVSENRFDALHEASSHDLTVVEVRQCFAMAQEASGRAGETNEEYANGADEMIFSEFIEVIARVATTKWENPQMRFIHKLEMAVEAILSVQSFIPDTFLQAHRQGVRSGRRSSLAKHTRTKQHQLKRKKTRRFQGILHTAIKGANYGYVGKERENAPVGTVLAHLQNRKAGSKVRLPPLRK
jgi:hypothetical protein